MGTEEDGNSTAGFQNLLKPPWPGEARREIPTIQEDIQPQLPQPLGDRFYRIAISPVVTEKDVVCSYEVAHSWIPEFPGWSEKGAAVAGSEDQPIKSLELRVPGFESDGTHFKTMYLRGGRMI